MKSLLVSAKFLALDLASTLVLLAVLQLTHSIPLAAGLGISIALGQVGYDLVRRKAVHPLLWLSLVVVVASGAATLFTHDARFVMLKPTIIYSIVGAVMMRRGWMNRYLPPRAAPVADVATTFGYVWAGLMFASAALNILLALNLDAKSWAAAMSAWGIASKIGLFLVQYSAMTMIGRRRAAAATAAAST